MILFFNLYFIIRKLPFICVNISLHYTKIPLLNFALAFSMVINVLVFDSCMIKALVFTGEQGCLTG